MGGLPAGREHRGHLHAGSPTSLAFFIWVVIWTVLRSAPLIETGVGVDAAFWTA